MPPDNDDILKMKQASAIHPLFNHPPKTQTKTKISKKIHYLMEEETVHVKAQRYSFINLLPIVPMSLTILFLLGLHWVNKTLVLDIL